MTNLGALPPKIPRQQSQEATYVAGIEFIKSIFDKYFKYNLCINNIYVIKEVILWLLIKNLRRK